ncbi:MAG: ribosomal-processing cysteine protease Prp [Anaeromassilibacillus sp.]
MGFRISGHSGSGEEGNDIICAAVSSAAYMTANTVTEIIGVEAQVAAEEGYMLVRIPASSRTAAFCSRVSSFICWGLRSNIQKISM